MKQSMLNRLERVQRRVAATPSLNRAPMDSLLNLLDDFPAEFLRVEECLGYKNRTPVSIEEIQTICREVAKQARAGDLTDEISVYRALPVNALEGIRLWFVQSRWDARGEVYG